MERDSEPPATKILLPLLASLLVAVLLVTGACGASAARDERRAQATPTTTAERTGRPPTGGADTSSPNRKPDLTGTITEVERGKPGAGSAGRILVEEDPNVEFSAGPNTEGWEKLFFEITDKTRIFVRRGGDGGEVVAATAADLAKGQMVDAWHGNHDVAESYPGQTVANRVVIHGSPPARSAVYFPVQSSESADAMTALIRGELTLDGEGCLRIEEPAQDLGSVPVWPAGFEAVTSGDETRVLDEEERVVGRVGEWITVGGGGIAVGTLEDNDLVKEPVLRGLLARCPGDYWLAAPY